MNAKAAKKERSHAAIVLAAARLLRERGIAGARVADVMGAAGLTVGGFYAHFASKEALVDDALRRTGRATREKLFGGLESKPPDARAVVVVVKRYLSEAHRDQEAGGCPLPAVASEIATTASAHREVLAEELEAFAGELAEAMPAGAAPARRQRALGALAIMVGGLSLARAVRGTPLSDEILRASRGFAARALEM